MGSIRENKVAIRRFVPQDGLMYHSSTPQEAAKLLISGEYVLLDVRESNEFTQGSINGAQHLALSRLQREPALLDSFKGRGLILYCQSGNRSKKACEVAEKQGFSNVHNLTGGIQAWRRAGQS